MADFSTLDSNQPNIPFSPSSQPYGLSDLTNPDNILSGTTRGVQNLGSPQVFSDGGNNQIIVADTVPRVLMGNQKTFGEGFYVSKSGVNAATNTDAAQWIFNSNQDVFKIVQSGSTVNTPADPLPTGVTSTTATPHGLGFLPGVFGFLNGTGSTFLTANTYYQTPYSFPGTFGGIWQPGIGFSFSVDATNVYTTIKNNTSVGITGIGSVTFKYYLLQESSN